MKKILFFLDREWAATSKFSIQLQYLEDNTIISRRSQTAKNTVFNMSKFWILPAACSQVASSFSRFAQEMINYNKIVNFTGIFTK